MRNLGLTAALAGSLLLAACGGDSGGSGSDSDTISVGWIGQLSGPQAIFGEQSTNAIKLALKEAKAAGGPDIKVTYEDNQADPAKSVTAFQSMMSKQPVTVLTGGSSVVIALAPLAEQNKLMLANVAAQSPALTTDKYSSVYNFIPTGKAEADELAKRVYATGARKVATEMVDADYGIDTTAEFTKAFKALGGTVIDAERHDLAATDMRDQLRKIKDSKPDAVVVCASEAEVGYVAAQAKELGVDAPMFGFTYALSPTNFKIAGDAMVGWRGVAVNYDSTTGVGKEFAAKYKAAYGKDPIIYAAISYEAMTIIAKGIAKVGNDPEALKKYIASVKDFPTVMGNTSMDSDRQVQIPLKIWQIGKGNTVEDWN